jgi:hypothetical protein
MTRVSRFIALAALASMAAQAPAFAQSNVIDKAYMGTWKLNHEKSKWVNGPMPKESTRTHEDRGNGFVVVMTESVSAQGVKSKAGYTYKPDGKQYPWAVMNATKLQTISLTMVDPLTVDFKVYQDGVLTQNGHRAISKDGKSMVITGTTADGKPANTQYFDKVQ